MDKIAVIIVSYKDSKATLEKLEKSLILEGLNKRNIFFQINDKNNLGYGCGINKILKKALDKFEYFLILNPDIKIKKGFLKILQNTFIKDNAIGIVGPKILNEKGLIWSLGGVIDEKRYSAGLIDNGRKDKKINKIYDVDFVSGTAMLIKKEVFKKVGLFGEDYFLYYEDVDFCIKAKRKNIKSVVNASSEIIHFESSSTGKDSPLMQYYLARNHLLFLERFAPSIVKVRELLRFPKTLFEMKGKKYELIGVRDYFIRRFGKNDYWG